MGGQQNFSLSFFGAVDGSMMDKIRIRGKHPRSATLLCITSYITITINQPHLGRGKIQERPLCFSLLILI
jgi:hypothetical protein